MAHFLSAIIQEKFQQILTKWPEIKLQINLPIIEIEPTPPYATPGSSGFDIAAAEDIIIPPHTQVRVRTGLRIKNPEENRNILLTIGGKGIEIIPELQIRPRSSMTWNKNVIVTNSPGTVDADYPDEILVLLYNLGSEEVQIQQGDRIAQGIITWSIRPLPAVIKQPERTGGFGSTGT